MEAPGTMAGWPAGGWQHYLDKSLTSPFHGASVQRYLFSYNKAAPVYQALTECQHSAKHFTHIILFNLHSCAEKPCQCGPLGKETEARGGQGHTANEPRAGI